MAVLVVLVEPCGGEKMRDLERSRPGAVSPCGGERGSSSESKPLDRLDPMGRSGDSPSVCLRGG